ncbi:MAG: flagellar motor protein MotB [Spirochaetales bacterium]|nr:flagellar motor protein MotB [Spirochaetales bacterium]
MADEDQDKCPKCEEGAAEWMTTYGDMVTLLLCFFVILMNPETIEGARMELIMVSFNGLGPLQGGNTLDVGELAELGNNIMAMPSTKRARGLDKARQTAVSMFKPEVKSKMVRITEDERGLVITLASDAFFRPASAEVDIESTREILQKVSGLLSSPDLRDRKFRIEGHTDSSPTDPNGPWPSNWELSAARSANVLHYLVDLGVDEAQFQIAGMSDTVPLADEETPEGMAYNRRVDIIVLAEAHE